MVLHSISSKRLPRLLAPLLFTLLLVGCSGGGSPKAQAVTGGTVSIRMSGGFSSFDPSQAKTTSNLIWNFAVYDSLLAFDSQGKLVGSLAKSWTSTPTSVTVTLKQGAKCSDGTPVTPDVVVNSFQHFLAKSPYVVRLFNQTTVTLAADNAASKFTLTLAKPFNEALYGLASPFTGIICPAGLAPNANFLNAAYGAGEYILASVGADQAVLRLRPEWNWGPFGITGARSGVPNTIILKVVADESTAANLLLTGGLDIATVNGPDNTRLLAEKTLSHRQALVYSPWILMMNEAAGRPTADQQVRHAIMESIDQKGWTQAALGGLGVTSPSILGTKAICYEDTSKLVPPVSVPAARATLQAAGYTGGATGPLTKEGKPLAVHVVSTAQEGQGGEYIVSQLQQAGFTATLSMPDQTGFQAAFLSGNYDVLVAFFSSPGPNPGNNIGFFYGAPPPKGTNLDSITDANLEDSIQSALTVQESDRCNAWKQVQEQVLRGYHALPVAAPAAQWYSPHGWSFFASQVIDVRSLVKTA